MEEIKKLVGNYLIRNPYTKGNKKTLPFNVLGGSFNPKYPVLVKTFEYRGMKRKSIISEYTIESVLYVINQK